MRRPKEPDFGYASAEFRRVDARIPKPVSTGVENAYMCGRAQTLRVDTNIFENGEKKVAFSNEYGYVWTGLQLLVMSTMPVVSSNFYPRSMNIIKHIVLYAQCFLYINETEPRSMHLMIKNTLFFMHNACFILKVLSHWLNQNLG